MHRGSDPILDMAGVMLVAVNRDGDVIHFNRECERLAGRPFGAASGSEVAGSLFSSADIQALRAMFNGSGRREHRFEGTLTSPEGKRRFIEWSSRAYPAHSGAVEYVVCSGVDITEHRQAEEALKLREERLTVALHAADEGLWDRNLETNEVYYSPRWMTMLGYADAEIDASIETFEELVHPDDRAARRAAISSYTSGTAERYEVEFRLRHKRGHYVPILSRATAVRDGSGRVVRLIGTHVDLTERKQFEEQLRQAELKYRAIVDRSLHGIYRTTPDGRIIHVNPAFARSLGYDRPEDILEFEGSLADHLYIDQGVRDEFRRTIETQGTVVGYEVRMRRRDGSIIWASIDARAVRDAAGNVEYYEGSLTDITDRKEAEQMKSDFVSFATHQLRTPLAGIKWMLELAQAPDLPEDIASYIQDARASADRLIRLVNELLDASRLESGRLAVALEPTDLVAVTQDVVNEVLPLVTEKGLRLAVDPPGRLPQVQADRKLLREVVLNLLSNAIRYTPPGGTITVRMECDGAMVRWSATDTGIGIPASAQARLFEKFFRADNASVVHTEGTGLGLYLVRLIIERSGGHAGCTSVEGKGSTFHFILPRAEI